MVQLLVRWMEKEGSGYDVDGFGWHIACLFGTHFMDAQFIQKPF